MKREERRDGRLGGLILIVVGTIFLLGRLGLEFDLGFWLIGPIVLVLIGLSMLRKRDIGGAFWMFGAASYLSIAELRLLDLGYASAWPIVLIVGGLGIIIESFVGPAQPPPEGNEIDA